MGLSRWMAPKFLLRLLALGATTSAAIVMVTAHDSARAFGMEFEAKYTNSPTFKYFVLINAITSGYTFIMLFFPSKTPYIRIILLLDLIVAMLLDSSISACLAVGQVGKKGNIHAGWMPICGQVPKFCNHITGSVVAGFIATVVYVVIILLSLHSIVNLLELKT